MRTQSHPVEDRRGRPVRAALEHHAFRLKLADVVLVGVQFLGALAGTCLLVVVLDHAFSAGLPTVLIRGAGLLLLSLIVVAAFALVARYARGFNKLFVARDFEKSHGVANNVVLNLLLIGQGKRTGYAVSAGAVQAAAEVNEPHGQVQTPPRNAAPWATLGGVALAWSLFALITPKEIGPSLRRLLGSSEAAPSATRIELLRPTAKDGVYAGEPLTMEFSLRGRAAGPLMLELLDGPGPDAPALVRHNIGRSAATGEPDDRALTLAGNEVGREVRFCAKAGDATLAGVINVQPEPDLLEYHVHVTPPAYLGLAASESKSAEVDAIADSEALWRVAANCAMTHPIFVFKGATETRTRMNLDTTDGRVASLAMPLTESGEYRIEFADSFGRSARRGNAHRVVVRGDRAPRVEITEPGTVRSGGDAVDLADAAWLRVAASDDWSLRTLELVVDRQGTIERRDLMPNSSTGRPGESVQVGVASADIELKIGQTARAWFEARDNRHAADGKPAPQVGQSRVVTLRRSADMTVAKHSKQKEETDVVSAEPGKGTVVAAKKERGSGQGDDKTATGDGPGDNPSDKGGAAGGSTRVSNEGTTATAQNDENANPEDMVSVGRETSPDEAGKGSKDGKDADPENAGENGKGDGDSDGESDGSFDEKMKKFIEEHGEDAKEAKKELDRKGGVTHDAKSTSPPKEREDSNELTPPEGETPPPTPTDTTPAPQDGQLKPSEKKNDVSRKPEGPPSPGEPKDEAGKNPSDAKTPQPGQKQPSDEAGKGENEKKEPGDKDAKDGEDSKDKGEGEKPADKGANGDADAKKPQPNAPGDSKNDPAKTDPQPPTPEPTDGDSKASDPASGGDGKRAESDELPPPGVEDGAAAEPGAISMPGAKVKSEGVEPRPMPANSDSSQVEKDTGAKGPRPEVVNVLELMERIENAGDTALDDLPWPAERKSEFLRELKRLQDTAKRSGVLADVKKWRSQAKLGSSQVQRGAGVSGDVGLGVGGEAMQADSLEKLAAPPDQRVPEHLRAVLEAYYRSLAEKRVRDGN